MSKKDDYFAKMDSQIKKWDAEVDKLRAKSEQMGAEARAKFAEQLEAMRVTRDSALKKLEELQGSSESAWRHMAAGVDHRMGIDEERPGEGFRQVQEVAQQGAAGRLTPRGKISFPVATHYFTPVPVQKTNPTDQAVDKPSSDAKNRTVAKGASARTVFVGRVQMVTLVEPDQGAVIDRTHARIDNHWTPPLMRVTAL